MVETEVQKERVILVGVSEQDGDDTKDSLEELKELVATAGAVTEGMVIQNRERIHPGTYVGTGKVSEIKRCSPRPGRPESCAMMSFLRHR